jgi:putative addiction module component (TIGR02574 family)
MSTSLVRSALKLPKAQRILLAQELWDSLAREQDGPELTDGQTAELDRRLARLDQNGPTGSAWAEVKARVSKTKRR